MPPKKPDAAKPPSVFGPDHLQDTLIFVLVLMVIGAVINRFIYYFQSGALPIAFLVDWLGYWFGRLWDVWKFLAAPIIGLSIWWATYSKMKLGNLVKEEEQMYGMEPKKGHLQTSVEPAEKGNPKWTKVLEHTNSVNSSDWRLAIIEADIMLDELLRAQQYHGDSIGEMLKSVEPSDMLTLDAAWEAHKVRNRIAHSGSDFELNERETKRVISLFEQVFKEFQII